MEKSVGESNNSLERSKEDLKPKYYMEFDSEIAAINFYNAYARSEDFSILEETVMARIKKVYSLQGLLYVVRKVFGKKIRETI